jgi:hypothetical protein
MGGRNYLLIFNISFTYEDAMGLHKNRRHLFFTGRTTLLLMKPCRPILNYLPFEAMFFVPYLAHLLDSGVSPSFFGYLYKYIYKISFF